MPFVFGWFLNALYLLLLTAVSPVLVFRRISQGKYRRGWREKLTGRLSRQHPERTCLWFHAVSVGEVVQLQAVLDEAEARFPSAEIFVTVTTETGYDVAKSKFPRFTISYFPLDFSWAVENALAAIRPSLIVLVELELWPNLIFAARRRKIPLVLINGRIGEKSFRGYSRIKPLLRRVLSCFDILAVQNGTYSGRLTALGAPPDRVVITGNIKFDRVQSDRNNIKSLEIREGFGIKETELVFIAGSTQDPEEEYALDSWLTLRTEFPRLRLILVPRHKERFAEVACLIRQRGCHAVCRSGIVAPSSIGLPLLSAGLPEVALLDTLGELAACWGLADVAFVGGSLTNRGGQNMIEPAGYGAAVLFGPNTWNFKDVAEALLSRNAARIVRSPEEMRDAVRQLLIQPEERMRLGQAARQFIASQQGATVRTLDLIATIVTDKSMDATATVSTSPRTSTSTRLWQFLKCLLFIVVMYFVGIRAYRLWVSAPPVAIRINGMWLLLAGLFYFVGWLPSVWFWRVLLRCMNQPIDWRDALRAYYVGHLGKYVPGKALVLVIRGSLTKHAGVSPLMAGMTAAFETLVYMASGAELALAFSTQILGSATSIGLPTHPEWMREMPLLLPALVLFITFSSTPMTAWLFTRIGRKAVPRDLSSQTVRPSITAATVASGVVATFGGWMCHALSLGCVLQSVSEIPFDIARLPMWLVASSISTVGGFVVLIAPGGLGVREGLLVEVLKDQPGIGPSIALVAAGLLRVVWFVTELIAAGIFFACGPSSKR